MFCFAPKLALKCEIRDKVGHWILEQDLPGGTFSEACKNAQIAAPTAPPAPAGK